MRTKVLRLACFAGLALFPAVANAAPRWSHYVDPSYGFAVDLPLSQFKKLDASNTRALTFAEIGGKGQLSIYGGPANGMTLNDFAERLSSGEQVRSITYKTGGKSWFVLSGYYDQDDKTAEPLVFYTKVLLSRDRSTFSAFEISYAPSEKGRLDPVLERIEDSFTRPR